MLALPDPSSLEQIDLEGFIALRGAVVVDLGPVGLVGLELPGHDDQRTEDAQLQLGVSPATLTQIDQFWRSAARLCRNRAQAPAAEPPPTANSDERAVLSVRVGAFMGKLTDCCLTGTPPAAESGDDASEAQGRLYAAVRNPGFGAGCHAFVRLVGFESSRHEQQGAQHPGQTPELRPVVYLHRLSPPAGVEWPAPLPTPPAATSKSAAGAGDTHDDVAAAAAVAAATRVTQVALAEVSALLGAGAAAALDVAGATFMDCGVTSKRMVQLVSRLNAAFRLQLPRMVLFDYPTLDGLAAHVATMVPASTLDEAIAAASGAPCNSGAWRARGAAAETEIEAEAEVARCASAYARLIGAAPTRHGALLQTVADAAASQGGQLLLTFAGQGEEYISQLRALWRGVPAVRPTVRAAAELLASLVAEGPAASMQMLYPGGIPLLEWLGATEGAADGATPAASAVVEETSMRRPEPSAALLVTASYPLIGLTQLLQYAALLHMAGTTPGAFGATPAADAPSSARRPPRVVTTGHSQGVVAAAVAASATSFEDLHHRTLRAVAYLFDIGTHTALETRTALMLPVGGGADAATDGKVDGDGGDGDDGSGEGAQGPTHLLAVLGLARGDVEALLMEAASNATNPGGAGETTPCAAQLALRNGVRAFVVGGSPGGLKAVHALVSRSAAAEDGGNAAAQGGRTGARAKPPRAVWVPSAAPYHTTFTHAAAATINSTRRARAAAAVVAAADVRAPAATAVATAAELRVPLLSTADGSDCGEVCRASAGGDSELEAELTRLQCSAMVDWPTAIGAAPDDEGGSAGQRLRGCTIIECGPGDGCATLIARVAAEAGASPVTIFSAAQLQGDGRFYRGLEELLDTYA